MVFELGAWLVWLVESFGLPAIFVGSLVSAATIIVPLPFDVLVFAAATTYNPILLILAAGFGAGVGELTAYYVGVGGEKAYKRLKNYEPKEVNIIRNYFDKYGLWAIILFAATPLPLDIIGILAGIARYEVKTFFIGALIGKLLKYSVIVGAGFLGMPWVFELFANGGI
ncbi:MAG: DedA family protein [Candidatus Diapherotrites archaeon]|nr:DedA family protein [Candidatus Diapherotrites archaeon]